MTASRTIAALGSLLVLGSFFGAATTRGVGSAIDGRELADLLLSGTVTAWIPRWVGATLYLVPLAGA
ncbi:MAG: hypothetical protein KDA94_14730, partial [Acidimicrobiales bacterium]|nr:hypothetical protein [Acidimicrobiales bacterium]